MEHYAKLAPVVAEPREEAVVVLLTMAAHPELEVVVVVELASPKKVLVELASPKKVLVELASPDLEEKIEGSAVVSVVEAE